MRKLILCIIAVLATVNINAQTKWSLINAQTKWSLRAGIFVTSMFSYDEYSGAVGGELLSPFFGISTQCNIPFKRGSLFTFSPSFDLAYSPLEKEPFINVNPQIGYKLIFCKDFILSNCAKRFS